MSSFKQSALELTNKDTSVAPAIANDLTIVARNGRLVAYDGTTDMFVAYTTDTPADYISKTMVAAISAGLDTRIINNVASVNTLFSTYANSTTVAAISAGLNTRITNNVASVNTLFSTYANTTTVANISAGLDSRATANTNGLNTLFSTYANTTTVANISAGLQTQITANNIVPLTNSVNTLFSTYANSTTVAAISAGLDTRATANTNGLNTLFSTYTNSTTEAAISAGLNTRITNNVASVNTLFSTYANSTTVATISAAAETNYVHKTNSINETITGIKTFTGGNTILNSGVANTGGLQFSQISTATPISSGYSAILGLDVNGNVGVSTIDSALFSPALAYWDGLNNPAIEGNAYPKAALDGTAAFIDSNNGVRLTPIVTAQNGSLNWNFAQLRFTRVQFNFKAGGGSGADATWFYCYANGIPTDEYGSGINKGYIVALSEYHAVCALGWGSGVDWVGNPTYKYGNTLAITPTTNIGNNQWHAVEIQILDNRVIMYYDGLKVIDYTDMYNRDRTGTFFGFGARTGGSTNEHYIKNLVVTKLGVDTVPYLVNPKGDVSNRPYDNNENTISPYVGTTTPLTVQGASGQAVDLQIWKNVYGTSLTRITSAGNVIVSPISGANGNIVSHDAIGTLLDSGVSINQITNNLNSINTLFSTYANSTTVAAISAGLDARIGSGSVVTSATFLSNYDNRYVNITGDTIYGDIVISSAASGGYNISAPKGTGLYNEGFGRNALSSNTTGEKNTAIGYNALKANTVGGWNVAIGQDCLLLSINGDDNVAIGATALVYNISGSDNIAIGYDAVNKNIGGTDNIGIGESTLYENTYGERNVAIGGFAGGENIIGNYNTGIGWCANNSNTNGNHNIGIGTYALYYNTTGSGNVAIGQYAGENETGSYKLYINSSTTEAGTSADALIYGDFLTGQVFIRGDEIATMSDLTSLGGGTFVSVSTSTILTNTQVAVIQTVTPIVTTFWSSPSVGATINIRNDTLDGENTLDGNGVNIEDATTFTIYAGEAFTFKYTGTAWKAF